MQLRLVGTAGVTTGGAVNRDGIGAVVRFTAGHGQTVLKPVLAGSSHASQNSLDLTFGMRGKHRGTVEVLWPGGVRNRLYGVKPFERLTLPEIPCSYADDWPSRKAYRYCVKTALGELRRDGLLTGQQQARLLRSALRAFRAERPRRPSPHFPFRSKHAKVLDSTMHYVDVGQGDPILLLHGNPTSSYLWRNVIPQLSKLGRVIAPDLIGMGRSGKPDIDYRFIDHSRYLEEFIKELDLSNITLVLHDWGSALGFHYARRHEDKVKALAFMEAILLPMPSLEVLPDEFAALFQALRTPGVGRDLIYDQNIFIEQVLPALTVRELGAEEMRRYRAPFLQPSSREPMLRWPNEVPIAGQPADNTEIINANSVWLSETALPKLLIYSKTGFTTPPALVAWAQVNLPNLQTFKLKEGLHYFQEDQPDAIGGEIARWYRSLVSTAKVR